MRFCPFCSADNELEATHCQACARKLPPPTPRRRKEEKRARTVAGPGAKPQASVPLEAEASEGEVEVEVEAEVAESESEGEGEGEAEEAELPAVGVPTKRTVDETNSAESRSEGQPARRNSDLRSDASQLPLPSRVARDKKAPVALEKPAVRASTVVPLAPGPRREAAARALTPEPREADPEVGTVEVAEPEDAAAAEVDESWGEEPEPGADERSSSSDDAGDDEHWPKPAKPEEPYDPHDWNARAETGSPPPTRLAVQPDHEALGHRPIQVVPVPDVPESGLWPSARYTISFVRARWQRRKAIKKLRGHIGEDTGRLDAVLGRLGAEARAVDVRTPALAAENEAIDSAERRRTKLDHDCAELGNRRAEENSRFAEIETERQAKVTEAESILEKAQNELGSLEAQRRSLRDKRKAADKKQKSYVKAADDREGEADKRQLGSEQEQLRASARTLRQDAADLDPERQDIERRLSALEKPISKVTAKVETLKAELESVRRSLNDAKEGHRLRLAEIEAEQGRKTRELAQAESEIQRRLITLGTLVNLNRIERPEFDDAYDQIDRLRGAIGGRSNEIDRLAAERDAYDKGSIIRGALTVAGAVLILLTVVLILVAAL